VVIRLSWNASQSSETYSPLKMEPLACHGTLVDSHQDKLRNNPEELTPHLHRGKSLEFCL